MFLHLTPLVASRLPALMEAIVGAYDRHHWPAALDCVATAVEAFGDQASTAGAFRALLRHVAMRSAETLALPGSRPHEAPALVKAFFHAAKAFLVF